MPNAPHPAAPATLELEHFLPYRLARAAETVSRDFARLYADRYGMTRPEWRCLATIGQFGAITATAIGAHSSLHKTKVSRAVRALEQRRWLVRTADEDDRRSERLSLTPAGQAAYADLSAIALAYEQTLLARLGPAAATLTAGVAALEKAGL